MLIFIVSEQLRADFSGVSERLFNPGGFRRLMEQGAYFSDCRNLASTFTSSALATLATGAWPSLHGIIADRWYDRGGKRPAGASAGLLLAGTVAAQVAAAPQRRLFLSSTDLGHGALLGGGSEARLFYMDALGQFATPGDAPEWLVEYNRLHPLEDLHNARWVAVGAGAGVPALRTLTYDPARPQEFLALYRSSPFAQSAQFGFVRELIEREKLGQGDTLDFLIVSVSAPELLGYEVGGTSPLVQQMILHLDREIGFTIDFLNKMPGPGNFAFVLAGAHGAPPAPEAGRHAQMAVPGESIARGVDRALCERFDTAPARTAWVERYVYPFLYLRPEALRRNPREVRAAAGQAALAHPAVAGYYTADDDCSNRGAWQRRFRNSFHLQRSGDVMLSYQPGFVEEYDAGRGISYGSLYNYDASVPLFLYGPQFRAQIFDSSVESVDIAPTLARLAGVELPSSSVGRVLGEAFQDAGRR